MKDETSSSKPRHNIRWAHKWSASLDEWNNKVLFDPMSQLLCLKATGDSSLYASMLDSVTIENKKVTCQECLEWMYA